MVGVRLGGSAAWNLGRRAHLGGFLPFSWDRLDRWRRGCLLKDLAPFHKSSLVSYGIGEIFGIALVYKDKHIFDLLEFECRKQGQLLRPHGLQVHMFARNGDDCAGESQRLGPDQLCLLDAKIGEELRILAQVGGR